MSMALARSILEQVLDHESLDIDLSSRAAAIGLRHRIYRVRELSRKESQKIYTPDHPGYNKSPWENLHMEIEDTPEGAKLKLRLGGEILGSVKITNPETGEVIS